MKWMKWANVLNIKTPPVEDLPSTAPQGVIISKGMLQRELWYWNGTVQHINPIEKHTPSVDRTSISSTRGARILKWNSHLNEISGIINSSLFSVILILHLRTLQAKRQCIQRLALTENRYVKNTCMRLVAMVALY